MLSSRKARGPSDQSSIPPFNSDLAASPVAARRNSLEERRRPAAKFGKVLSPLSNLHEHRSNDGEAETDHGAASDDNEDEAGEQSPLLPIFSAEFLDSLPVYNITHTIRLLIIPRCETTLSWDQLRAPQVSQFLVKPIQQQIRTSHFSKATLYALMANCLQFNKEVHTNPGNSGVSRTRAMVSELLAIRLLRSFSTRELIDALSYDFYPLQGLPADNGAPGPNWDNAQRSKGQGKIARVSTLEIAIRAQSKRFLAHPLVIQQLEAIWAGTIVFHHAADNLHRTTVKVVPNQNRGYGAAGSSSGPTLRASPEQLQPAKQRDHRQPLAIKIRRSVTLYDPKEASLFKLSRLRVPRYRQFLSTCSFAVLLGLFVAVLVERSLSISPLEVLFWFWSAGFLLDEVVGFNEQGFSLYIMSFWNTFDVGILCLLICYYFLRLYGIFLPSTEEQHQVANMAYDLLAANAVLLFPRLFSVLDHYRYFSQLLIAFRMMAMDLVAVFILILISCSGFFVAFTLSFGKAEGYNGGAVAYSLFQILMGFTPAAWDSWPHYNLLGKSILTLFLFICHFLIVTILITVLTNSFMSIVQNANEEHQFVFAVNTISMVKSDALFSYLAPTNIIAWVIAPLRFFLPFREFVRVNRTAIKATHFPILFIIYAYERLVLHRNSFEASELIEPRGRLSNGAKAFDIPSASFPLLSPRQGRVREPSVATFRKDKALEEVFRRPFPGDTLRGSQRNHQRRNTSNAISHWMSNIGPDCQANPPMEQDRTILDRLEAREVVRRRSRIAMLRRQDTRNFTEATMSVTSDPEDFEGDGSIRPPARSRLQVPKTILERTKPQSQTEADDELATNDEDDILTLDRSLLSPANDHAKLVTQPSNSIEPVSPDHIRVDYITSQSIAHTPSSQPRIPHFGSPPTSDTESEYSRPQLQIIKGKKSTPSRYHKQHTRNASINTIIYDPPAQHKSSASSSPNKKITRRSGRTTGTVTPNNAPKSIGRQTPKRTTETVARPIMPPRTAFQSAPNLAGMLSFGNQRRDARHSSLTAFDIGSDLGDNKAVGGGFINAAIPASFATQMAHADAGMRARKAAIKQEEEEDKNRMSKLMLARMTTLEEGFRDVIREVQEMRQGAEGKSDRRPEDGLDARRTRSTRDAGNGRKGCLVDDKENEDPDGLAFRMESDVEQ